VDAAVVHRGEDQPAGSELVQPGGRDPADADRGDDPVVRGAIRVPVIAVGGEGGDAGDPGPVQRGGGLGDDAGGRVERDDRPAGDGADEGGGVAGAGADLQHAGAGPQVEGLEHAGRQRGLRRAGHAGAGGVQGPAGDQNLVGVDGVEDGRVGGPVPGDFDAAVGAGVEGGDEHVSGDPAERAVHGVGPDRPGVPEPVGECGGAGDALAVRGHGSTLRCMAAGAPWAEGHGRTGLGLLISRETSTARIVSGSRTSASM
jgi:hypothetical protein